MEDFRQKKNYEQAVLGNSLEAEIWKMLEEEKDWSREVVKEAIVVWVKKRMVFGDQEQSRQGGWRGVCRNQQETNGRM